MNFIKSIALGAACALGIAGGANAAVYTVINAVPDGGNDFSADIDAFFGGNAAFGLLIQVTAGASETLTFSRYGSESGFTNKLEINGTPAKSLTESEDAFGCGGCFGVVTNSSTFSGLLAADALKFTSDLGVDAEIGDMGFGVYYDSTKVGMPGVEFLLAYDDGSIDDNHDDMLVLTAGEIEVVPLPAGLLLMGTALAGLGMARRRKS